MFVILGRRSSSLFWTPPTRSSDLRSGRFWTPHFHFFDPIFDFLACWTDFRSGPQKNRFSTPRTRFSTPQNRLFGPLLCPKQERHLKSYSPHVYQNDVCGSTPFSGFWPPSRGGSTPPRGPDFHGFSVFGAPETILDPPRGGPKPSPLNNTSDSEHRFFGRFSKKS